MLPANLFAMKCRRVDSNHRPKDYETFALTSELRRLRGLPILIGLFVLRQHREEIGPPEKLVHARYAYSDLLSQFVFSPSPPADECS